MSDKPHPELIPLLEKYGITWEEFSKQGRPPAGVSEKRKQIVTELHFQGLTWDRMCEITGKPTSFIQRNTRAMWNKKSRNNVREVGRKIGSSWKGQKRPGQLEKQWESGNFEHLRGRTRTPEELRKQKESWTPERRKEFGKISKQRWIDPEYRSKLLAYHRSPEERVRRSQLQSQRMADDPEKWTRGRGAYLKVTKCLNGQRIWVRSTYEQAAVHLLEDGPQVESYQYERTFELVSGKWIKPDFVAHYIDGSTTLIEVKAGWVLNLPDTHKITRRLREAELVAKEQGWEFNIWAEEELQDAFNRTA